MAHLIPDNARSRPEVSAAVRRLATGLKIGLDDDTIVWYEPLSGSDREPPRFIVFLPDNGIAVLEVVDVRASKLLGVLRNKMRVERDGDEVEVEQPLVRADQIAAELARRIAEEPRLAQSKLQSAEVRCSPQSREKPPKPRAWVRLQAST